MLAAERFQRAGKILVRPQPQRKGAAGRLRTGSAARGDRPEQLEIGLGVRLRREDRAVDAERFDLEGLGDDSLLGQDMAATDASVGLRPQRVAMEERRAVALAERHRRQSSAA